ncbi:Na+/H+ antiporter NhaC family protein [Acidaminococcus timonensis]|uniref:Na+/H+ antiporter NhaC family protein n=1 Tax=Acidaminococcus timonensis TaxID=1871002 RepID=UPI0025CE2C14|nr:Na+/H+ antiporter NhaC family protein [Acidaminococcus timonensis]
MKKEKTQADTGRNLGGVAFLPLLVFLVLYIGAGLAFTLLGFPKPFSFLPRHVALLAGTLVALYLWRKGPIDEKLKVYCSGMGDSGVMMIVLIYLLAGGFQGAAAAIGGKTSVVNFCLQFIPPSLLIPGVFLMCCFISTAIGTSMGTIAAMAPVAIGVAQGAGLNLAAVCAAVICGSYFGDNLSMISDTTIAAAEGCGSKMKDKFRMNFSIALPAALVSLVLYYLVSGQVNGAIQVGDYNFLQIVPYIFVLVLALMGVNVALVLFGGILMTGVIGVSQGTVDIFTWAKGLGSGMEDMFSISIVAILVSGIIALVRYYGGVEWMVAQITKRIHGRKGAEYGIGLLSGILSAAMVNNTIAIIVTCPIAKVVGGKYNIAPKRLASLVDIFACSFLCIMPHDGGMLIVTQLAGTSPLDVMQYCYYVFALIIATCITIQFGTHENK